MFLCLIKIYSLFLIIRATNSTNFKKYGISHILYMICMTLDGAEKFTDLSFLLIEIYHQKLDIGSMYYPQNFSILKRRKY